jgi:transposase
MARRLSGERPFEPSLRADWWFPPALDQAAQGELKAAVRGTPREVGIELPDWNWKVVRAFNAERFQQELGRSSCLNYLHRLDFVLKRPKKRLLKADAEKRAAFVALYITLRAEAEREGAKLFFADEALFRADCDLRGKWVPRGEPALVNSTSPAHSEKVVYYSAVCLETGEVESMEVVDTCTAETSAEFLKQLRERYSEPLIVVWDNGPAHRGEALRTFLKTPDLKLRLVALPAYSPDFNADEPLWDWIREEVTRNVCLGTKAKVREQVGAFFAKLGERTAEVKSRCRTALQAQADALSQTTAGPLPQPDHVVPTLA